MTNRQEKEVDDYDASASASISHSSSSKLNHLAYKILESSGVFTYLAASKDARRKSDGSDSSTSLPPSYHGTKEEHMRLTKRALRHAHSEEENLYLLALERILDIQYIPSSHISADLTTCNVNTTSEIQTQSICIKTSGNVMRDTITHPKYWTPPLPTSLKDSLSMSFHRIDDECNDPNGDGDHIHDFVLPVFEELAPLPPTFYRYVAQLLVFAYENETITSRSPQQYKRTNCVNNNNISGENSSTEGAMNYSHKKRIIKTSNGNDDKNKTEYSNTYSFQQGYSLYQNHYSVRITKILSELMEINILGSAAEYAPNRDFKHITFLSLLLHHAEGNTIAKNDIMSAGTMTKIQSDDHISSIVTCKQQQKHQEELPTQPQTKKRIVPIIHSIFMHYTSIPFLEGYIHSMVRHLKSTSLASSSTTMITSEDSTAVFESPSIATSQKLRQVKEAEKYQQRLENELKTHISTIERIIGLIYTCCDASLRSKCRFKIGNVLHSFALTGGISGYVGNNFRSNSNIINELKSIGSDSTGGHLNSNGSRRYTMTMTSMGLENNSAAGIDSMLRVLLRILHGMKDIKIGSNNNSCKYKVHNSYQQLLFQILLPLHKPSGMVLWRDQTPILGLYHKTLVQCIGAIISRDKTLVWNVINAILHPDIWPVEGGRGSAVANTPKVILLLHEVDTYLSLLDLHVSDDDERCSKYSSIDAGVTASASAVSQEFEERRKNRGTKEELSDDVIHKERIRNQRERQIQSLSDAGTVSPLILRLASCMASDNSRTSERALEFFKNAQFQALIKHCLPTVMTPLLRALCRVDCAMELPWNPTVRKMSLLVLRELESYNKTVFRKSCENLFDRRSGSHCSGQSDMSTMTDEKKKRTTTLFVNREQTDFKTESGSTNASKASSKVTRRKDLTSLSNAMGSWRPPSRKGTSEKIKIENSLLSNQSSSLNTPPPISFSLPKSFQRERADNSQPPLTITGVAPWAMEGTNVGGTVQNTGSFKNMNGEQEERTRQSLTAPAKRLPGVPRFKRRAQNYADTTISTSTPMSPPSFSDTTKNTANKKNNSTELISSRKISHDGKCTKFEESTMKGLEEISEQEYCNDHKSSDISSPALAKVLDYMNRLKPLELADDGFSSWAKAEMAESPVLLPNLRFHDLVFGHTLGTGAFSVVKYARRIVKNKTRTNWPEYAVKVVSTQKIKELGYEQSVNREIAILKTLSHPGIARLVSSFRFRDGAYLVLEYASGGDLHTLLKKNGSLDKSSTRFVVGEIIAALWSIHEQGFVYGDLKPENLLITESGHIKVTDFGGCRPVTTESRSMINNASKNVLRRLRDGDWREVTPSNDFWELDEALDEGYDEDNRDDDDMRIEGTTAYLPPEVVLGSVPTAAADSWALGCVLFQCLSGRPPILEDDDLSTKQKIVSFDIQISSRDEELFMGSDGTDAFCKESQSLVKKLLHPVASERPTMIGCSQHMFFDGMDVFSLYKQTPYPLNVGSFSPVADAKWSRRQFSSIWAPQPQDYTIGIDENPMEKKHGAFECQAVPIEEGDEAPALFSKNFGNSMLGKIIEK